MTLKEKILAVMEGVHVAAIATIADGRPAVRFMALTGFEDTSLVGATMRSSRKVQQLKKNQDAALSIWSCREYSDPYIVIQAKGTIHEDFATKKKYWDPMLEPFFRSPENPDYVVLKFIPERIEYYDMSGMEVWER